VELWALVIIVVRVRWRPVKAWRAIGIIVDVVLTSASALLVLVKCNLAKGLSLSLLPVSLSAIVDHVFFKVH
jgi:hypothetical protein